MKITTPLKRAHANSRDDGKGWLPKDLGKGYSHQGQPGPVPDHYKQAGQRRRSANPQPSANVEGEVRDESDKRIQNRVPGDYQLILLEAPQYQRKKGNTDGEHSAFCEEMNQ